MRIIITENYEQMSRQAANLVAAQVQLNPDSVLGLATGSSPVGLYQELIKKYQQGDLDFSKVSSVNLDEYCGLSGEHDQSYRYFMEQKLFKFINMKKTYLPNGQSDNIEAECAAYDERIASLGGVDLQLLGLGNNGHIGFNEPDSHFAARTHCIELAQTTISANARFFASPDDVPRKAITMGIKTIFSARRILLIVSGDAKAEILRDVLYGQITPVVPASILQLHNDLTIVADKGAARYLK